MAEIKDWNAHREMVGLPTSKPSTLKGGDGGGTFDGMEAKVARLESDMEHVKKGVDRLTGGVDDIKKALGEIKVTLAAIDERTKPLPSKWDVFLILVSTLGVLGTVATMAVRFFVP